MAERRMFAKSIVLSDAFLDMPLSARCLYFTLGMLADDDGFVGSPKAIMRQCGASQDDMAVLLQKRFILAFESGVIVIKHWRMNNYLQKDRHKDTTYLEELATLDVDDKGAYTEKKEMYTECIQTVYKTDTQGRLGQGRLGQGRVVEVNEDGNDTEFELIGGTLGKNVVLLTPIQSETLLDKLGLDAYNHYVDKLSTFIIKNDAKVGNHYATILKWAAEDSKI